MRQHQAGARALSTLLRAAIALTLGTGCALVILSAGPVPAGASGIVPPSIPSVNVPPQVMPACTRGRRHQRRRASTPCCTTSTTPVGSKVSARSSCRAATPPTRCRAAAHHRRRGARRPRSLAVLRPRPRLEHAALTGAAGQPRPVAARRLTATPRAAPTSPTTRRRSVPTSPGCTTTGRGAPTPPAPRRPTPSCWGHRDNILGDWTTTGTQTAQMGDADTAGGTTPQIFANQVDPADALVDTITPSSLPTPPRRRPRRGPGAARLELEHGRRHAGHHRGELLRHFARCRRCSSAAWRRPTWRSTGTAS